MHNNPPKKEVKSLKAPQALNGSQTEKSALTRQSNQDVEMERFEALS
jgi:hypothetical protein